MSALQTMSVDGDLVNWELVQWWHWTVMYRLTRQITAFVLGDRSEATCRKLWDQIPPAYKGCRSYSDFWEAYQLIFPVETHECVGREVDRPITWNAGFAA